MRRAEFLAIENLAILMAACANVVVDESQPYVAALMFDGVAVNSIQVRRRMFFRNRRIKGRGRMAIGAALLHRSFEAQMTGRTRSRIRFLRNFWFRQKIAARVSL